MQPYTTFPRLTLWLLVLLVAGGGIGVQAGLFGSDTDVEEIATEELRALMADGAQSDGIVLVDVRSPREIAVSMIPGAISVSQFEANAGQYRDVEVITYCTIGVRSETYAEKLLEAGFRARNYVGSILDWVGAGLPVVTPDGEATRRVHVYSREFSVPPPYEAVTQ